MLQAINDQDEVFLEFLEAEIGIGKGTANRLMCEIAIETGQWTPYCAYECVRCHSVNRMRTTDAAQISALGSVAVCCSECATVQNITAEFMHLSWKKTDGE